MPAIATSAGASTLESLIPIYCRHTTDAATEHPPGLRATHGVISTASHRRHRSDAELLSTLESLERVTLDTCHALTNEGVARLARLPRLRASCASRDAASRRTCQAFRPGVIGGRRMTRGPTE